MMKQTDTLNDTTRHECPAFPPHAFYQQWESGMKAYYLALHAFMNSCSGTLACDEQYTDIESITIPSEQFCSLVMELLHKTLKAYVQLAELDHVLQYCLVETHLHDLEKWQQLLTFPVDIMLRSTLKTCIRKVLRALPEQCQPVSLRQVRQLTDSWIAGSHLPADSLLGSLQGLHIMLHRHFLYLCKIQNKLMKRTPRHLLSLWHYRTHLLENSACAQKFNTLKKFRRKPASTEREDLFHDLVLNRINDVRLRAHVELNWNDVPALLSGLLQLTDTEMGVNIAICTVWQLSKIHGKPQPDAPCDLQPLQTPQAMELWETARQEGWVDDKLQPLMSANKATILANVMGTVLNITPLWIPFQKLWGIANMAKRHYETQSYDYYDTYYKMFSTKLK